MYIATKYSIAFCWRNCRKLTIKRIIVSILTTLSLYLTIQATGFVINSVQALRSLGKHEFSSLILPVIFLGLVVFFQAVTGRFEWIFRNKWHQVLRYEGQRELNDLRARLDVARFGSKVYDDLTRRIQELPYGFQVRPMFAEEVLRLLTTCISFALFAASLLWYKPMYALVLLVFAFPLIVLDFRSVTLWWAIQEKLVPKNKHRNMLERAYYSPIAFVQALMFNQMPTLRTQIKKSTDEVVSEYDVVRGQSLKFEMVSHLSCALGLCFVFIHAIWSAVTTNVEIGTLTIVMSSARTFNGNLESIVSLIAEQWNTAKGVILIEKDFFGLQPVLRTENPVIPTWTKPPVIRFDRVSFTYPDTDKEVLHDVSFTIPSGATVAIVGKTGHGKSTVEGLLMRHYDPTTGAIYVDDINLQNIKPSVWSGTATALKQDFVNLDRTIGDEVASSRIDLPFDRERVEVASRFAYFDEVVAREESGFDTQMGKEFGGRVLSGGQNQRLALARARHRDSQVFVLDEPDAKLDPESAEIVIDNIFALTGVTVVMITHHVSRAKRCDHIILMNEGSVAEQGTHAELMALGGRYASMFKKDEERLSGMSD